MLNGWKACTAYSRYMLDVGQSEDWLALQFALAPCLIGYGAIAKRLNAADSSIREGNPYWRWVENYIAEDFVEAVKKGSGRLVASKFEEPRRLNDSSSSADRGKHPKAITLACRRIGSDIYSLHRNGG